MKKYFIFLCVFLFINANIQSQNSDRQNNSNVMNLILSEKYGYDYFGKTLYEERVRRSDQSRIHFFQAMKLYENNRFGAAMLELEKAIQLCTEAVYYYHYGVCLMDIHDYRNAERAFMKALQFFNSWTPISDAFYDIKNSIYTYDQNGAPRERYYTYYNLACVHAIMNNLDTSFDYLKEAFEYGYPYIDYIYRDLDLRNVFNKPGNVVNQIQAIYKAGSVNTFAGKSFEYGRASEWDEYVFVDGKNIFVRSTRDFDHVRYGTYAIINYQIIMHYTRETGKRGEGPLPGGGVMGAYERYIPYENRIDELEIITIKDMSRIWRESRFDPNPDRK
jgi:tetratricopeptide (TPR) repeat protein